MKKTALDALPEWYQFHNSRTGKGILLQLPDLRHEKESFYTSLYHDNKRKTTGTPTTPVAEIVHKPFLRYYEDDTIKWFVETFETKEVQKWYKDYTYGNTYDDTYETVNENVRFLLSTGETIAIEDNEDWVNALEKTVSTYKTAKLSEALWEAWAQYQMTLQSGLGFSLEENSYEDFRKIFAEQILAGRKLNGEPEDFDF